MFNRDLSSTYGMPRAPPADRHLPRERSSFPRSEIALSCHARDITRVPPRRDPIHRSDEGVGNVRIPPISIGRLDGRLRTMYGAVRPSGAARPRVRKTMAFLPFIRGIASYLPAGVLTNTELERRFPEWSAAKILEKTGIAQRHVAAEGELGSDMAVQAARRLLERQAVDPRSIDVLVFCSQSLDYILPSSACLIQDKLGIPPTCMSF